MQKETVYLIARIVAYFIGSLTLIIGMDYYRAWLIAGKPIDSTLIHILFNQFSWLICGYLLIMDDKK